MQVQISETTSGAPLGLPRTRVLLEVAEGPYAGRRVALFMTTPTTIALSFADRPYTTWSLPATIVSGASDAGFDADFDANHNIHLLFVDSATAGVKACRLLFSDGEWTAQPVVTAFTGDVNTEPSLAITSDGVLWLAWSRLAGGTRSVHVKSSVDGGAVWGSGPSDSGDELHSGGTFASPMILAGPSRIDVVYYYASDYLCHRSRQLSGGAWTDPVTVASGAEVTDRFDAAVRPDGLLAVVWSDSFLYYREFDGNNWGPVQTLTATPVGEPQLAFCSMIPVIIFEDTVGTGQNRILVVDRVSGTFSEPRPADHRNDYFGALYLYHAATASFADVTTAAQTTQAGDLVHPESNCLFAAHGDAAFIGMDVSFRYLYVSLAVTGNGGVLAFSYWDGAAWRAFTPATGSTGFDTSPVTLELWKDYQSIPANWQKLVVNNASLFWIKIEVLSDFSTGPVGSMASAISDAFGPRMGA